MIAGDKYGSRGQLAHTWLLSLGEWELPTISSQGLAFVRQIMRQISPLCYIHHFVLTSGNMSPCRVDFAQMFLIERVLRRQEKLPGSKTKRPFSAEQLLTFEKLTRSFVSCFKCFSLLSFLGMLATWPVPDWWGDDLCVLKASPGCN